MKIIKVNLPTHRRKFEQLHGLERHSHHSMLHQMHRKHNIAKRTLFYIKEYGSKSNASHTIIKESVKVLIFAVILSTLGGLSIEHVKTKIISFIPLLILLPLLNGMIGNYGIIISSKFTTLLYTGKVDKNWKESKDLRKLLKQIIFIAIITAILSSIISLVISKVTGNYVGHIDSIKLILLVIIDVLVILTILTVIVIYGSFYFFKHNEDPNNFLIPITTSIADFGNMIVLSIFVAVFF